MPSIKLITDSTADLGPERSERLGILVVPLLVQFDQDSFRDGLEIDPQQLFRMVEERKRLPKTASPSPGAFFDAFTQATADGSEAIYIGLSSQLSSTVQNARIAADMLPPGRVAVFDSGNLCSGIGLLVLMAHDMVQAGKSREEILAALEASRPKVRSTFLPDSLEYLHMGGRCSSVQALAGALLRIRPIIAVVDGGMTVATKTRGARQKAIDAMLATFEEDVQAGLVRPERIFIADTGEREEAPEMVEAVRRAMPEAQEVGLVTAGSVIGTHCGPNTVGLFYMLK